MTEEVTYFNLTKNGLQRAMREGFPERQHIMMAKINIYLKYHKQYFETNKRSVAGINYILQVMIHARCLL